jgi:hypothetical protein
VPLLLAACLTGMTLFISRDVIMRMHTLQTLNIPLDFSTFRNVPESLGNNSLSNHKQAKTAINHDDNYCFVKPKNISTAEGTVNTSEAQTAVNSIQINRSLVGLIAVPASLAVIKNKSGNGARFIKTDKEIANDQPWQSKLFNHWTNPATAGARQAMLAEAKSYFSRTAAGTTVYTDHLFAGMTLAGSETGISLYHNHSFNNNYAGTQTSLKFNKPLLKRESYTLTVGAGVSFLTRKTYSLPQGLLSVPASAMGADPKNIPLDQVNAFGVEAGMAFYSRKLYASVAAININRPVLTPSKFQYRQPIAFEASAAYCFDLGNGHEIIPFVTVRNLPTTNVDALVLTSIHKVTVGGGLQNINFHEESISPMVYAEASLSKNVKMNASFSRITPLAEDDYSDNVSEPRNMISLGVKYSR